MVFQFVHGDWFFLFAWTHIGRIDRLEFRRVLFRSDWLADFTSDTIGHVAPERPLVIPGHINLSESGASISELNSVTLCNLSAAVHPEERERGSRGGAGQTDRAAELKEVCVVWSHHHTRDWCCGGNRKKKWLAAIIQMLNHLTISILTYPVQRWLQAEMFDFS